MATLYVKHNRSTGSLHLGNPDRDNPADTFDRPGKLLGCIKACEELAFELSHNGIIDLGLTPICLEESLRRPTLAQLTKVHPPIFLNKFLAAAEKAKDNEMQGKLPYDSSFGKEAAVSPHTYNAALTSVGCALDCIDIVLQRPKETSFSLAWPPGHHAERNLAMGFCYLSTAAIAAFYARDHIIQRRPGNPNKVVIIDIDHHRGNGTADAIANQENLFLIDMVYKSTYDESSQRYTDGIKLADGSFTNQAKEYPPTRDDLSIPIRAHPITRAPNVLSHEFLGNQNPEFLTQYFIDYVLPQLREINPDVIFWSLGLDSAEGDVLGGLGHVPGSFYTMIAGTRQAFPESCHTGIQEGGYDETNWYRVLKPSLLALHPESSTNYKFFSRFKDKFLA